MSKIKFRAWDNELKVMLTGHNQYGDDEPNFSTEYSSAGAFTRLWEALARFEESKRFVLMRYTELKDKQDKEIYEGDIITQEIWNGEDGYQEPDETDEFKGVVIYTIAGFDIQTKDCNDGEGEVCLMKCDNFVKTEVIGNIYENPELIKEKEL